MYIMGTILRHGSPKQKQRYLPKIATGELRLQAFGVTEPTSGTDTTSLRTFAEREGDHYVVNGQKVWTSRAEHSDLMLLLARTTPRDQVEAAHRRALHLHRRSARGARQRPDHPADPHDDEPQLHRGLLRQHEVPAENLVGEEGKGFRYILDGMNAERLLIARNASATRRWFLKKAIDYAQRTRVFGRPIGQNQGIQFPLARAYAQMRAADLMCREGCASSRPGRPCGEEANMAKLLGAEASWAAAEACLQTHGGFGFAEEYDVERKWRETRLYQVAPIAPT